MEIRTNQKSTFQAKPSPLSQYAHAPSARFPAGCTKQSSKMTFSIYKSETKYCPLLLLLKRSSSWIFLFSTLTISVNGVSVNSTLMLFPGVQRSFQKSVPKTDRNLEQFLSLHRLTVAEFITEHDITILQRHLERKPVAKKQKKRFKVREFFLDFFHLNFPSKKNTKIEFKK